MADEKKTMDSSVFGRLAGRFSECRKEVNRDKVMSNGDVPNVMSTAGEALFWAISSKEIDLGDTPDWFAIKPQGPTKEKINGTWGTPYSWDLYWLFAIKWLDKNKPDSGITFSLYIPRENPEGLLHSGEGVEGHFHWLRLRGEHLKRAWRQLATASEDACLYLAGKFIREAEGNRRGQKKKYTPEQLKQVRASYDKYYQETNDAKAAWNQAAKEHRIKSGKAAEMACRRYLK